METGVSLGQSSAPGSVPRRLSTHQKSVLIQVLRTFPDEKVGVCHPPDSPDGAAYAEDFVTIFKAIDWFADESVPAENLPATPSGLAIALPAQKLPAAAEALRDSLRIYNLEAAILTDKSNLCAGKNFVLAITNV